MDATAILQLVANVVPLTQNLVSALVDARTAAEKPSTLETVLKGVAGVTPEIKAVLEGFHNQSVNTALDIVNAVTPAAAALVHQLDAIHEQTKDEYAAVWEPIREDWKATVAKWNGSQFQK